MTVCNFCNTEITQKGGGDEYLDYCPQCERIVEGHTREVVKKLYTIIIKSHCEAPDYENSVEAESRQEAIDHFYEALKGKFDKEYIDMQMANG